jgi:hypothetical protein
MAMQKHKYSSVSKMWSDRVMVTKFISGEKAEDAVKEKK